MVAFDVPLSSTLFPFESRYESLIYRIPADHPLVGLAFRWLGRHRKQVTEAVGDILSHSGEGVILRKPNSIYEHGKSQLLLKLKAVQSDKEGIVTSVNDKNDVALKLADGTTVVVVSENVQTGGERVKKGDIVTFSYTAHSHSAVPVNVVISRIRHDIDWDQVVLSHVRDLPQSLSLNKYSGGGGGGGGEEFTSQPVRHWTQGQGSNMRRWLIQFARSRGFDPLVPSNWYHFPRKELEKIKGGITILQHFGGYVKMLQHLFPDIGLEVTKFRTYALGKFWDTKKRRKWISKLAEEKGLDPLVPDTWYKLSTEKISDSKTRAIVRFYGGSFKGTLLSLFPEIGLDELKFPRRSIRSYLEEFARRKNMEPLNPQSWYTLTRRDLEQDQYGRSIINRFKGGYAKLISQIFPDIGLELDKFPSFILISNSNSNSNSNLNLNDDLTKWHESSLICAVNEASVHAGLQESIEVEVNRDSKWKKLSTRKAFFEDFARVYSFDPLLASQWYQHAERISSLKDGKDIMRLYNGDLSKGLDHIFPNIGIKQSDFYVNQDKEWDDKLRRRQFFIRYAKRHAFDYLIPLNWYAVPLGKLMQEKGAAMVMYYYNNNVGKALVNLFPDIGFDINQFSEKQAR